MAHELRFVVRCVMLCVMCSVCCLLFVVCGCYFLLSVVRC